MIVFSIAGQDLSCYILVPTYTMNSEDVVTRSWTDANEIEHRVIVRTRVSGSFKMKFHNKDTYLEILDLFEQTKTEDGYTPVEVYVNNLNEVKEINAFVTCAPANTMPLYGVDAYDGFTVNIKER